MEHVLSASLKSVLGEIKIFGLFVIFGVTGYLIAALSLVSHWRRGDAVNRRQDHGLSILAGFFGVMMVSVVPYLAEGTPNVKHASLLLDILAAWLVLDAVLWFCLRSKIKRLSAENQTELNTLIPTRIFGVKSVVEKKPKTKLLPIQRAWIVTWLLTLPVYLILDFSHTSAGITASVMVIVPCVLWAMAVIIQAHQEKKNAPPVTQSGTGEH